MGGVSAQGKAFGFLEGGRGFIAASLGALGVVLFTLVLPNEIETISILKRKEAFQFVIFSAAGFCVSISLLLFFFFKDSEIKETVPKKRMGSLEDIQTALRLPSVH